MNENKVGQFIAELRKEKQMTQKDLATQLYITDKAVSKWERGLSYPDISLITSLADILGVTTSELLEGQRNGVISQDIERTVDTALVYAAKSEKTKITNLQSVFTRVFSIAMFLSLVLCLIIDVATSQGVSWSLYPISSIVLTWCILMPLFKYGKKGLWISLVSLSLLIIPFLYIINRLVGHYPLIMPIGIKVSLISIVYLWSLYFIFKKMKERKMMAASLSLLFAIPLHLVINFIVSHYLLEPILDIWDLFSFGILIIGAIFFWRWDSLQK